MPSKAAQATSRKSRSKSGSNWRTAEPGATLRKRSPGHPRKKAGSAPKPRAPAVEPTVEPTVEPGVVSATHRGRDITQVRDGAIGPGETATAVVPEPEKIQRHTPDERVFHSRFTNAIVMLHRPKVLNPITNEYVPRSTTRVQFVDGELRTTDPVTISLITGEGEVDGEPAKKYGLKGYGIGRLYWDAEEHDKLQAKEKLDEFLGLVRSNPIVMEELRQELHSSDFDMLQALANKPQDALGEESRPE